VPNTAHAHAEPVRQTAVAATAAAACASAASSEHRRGCRRLYGLRVARVGRHGRQRRHELCRRPTSVVVHGRSAGGLGGRVPSRRRRRRGAWLKWPWECAVTCACPCTISLRDAASCCAAVQRRCCRPRVLAGAAADRAHPHGSPPPQVHVCPFKTYQRMCPTRTPRADGARATMRLPRCWQKRPRSFTYKCLATLPCLLLRPPLVSPSAAVAAPPQQPRFVVCHQPNERAAFLHHPLRNPASNGSSHFNPFLLHVRPRRPCPAKRAMAPTGRRRSRRSRRSRHRRLPENDVIGRITS